MTEKIRLMIRYEEATVYEIVRRCAEDESIKELEFTETLCRCTDENTPFSAAWSKAVRESRLRLTDGDRSLLMRIGNILGTTDCEGQLSTLSGILAEIDKAIEDAEEQYHAKGRLYRSLGAIAGAAIAVIIV